MIIDREIKQYIVFSEDTIVHALEKIGRNKLRVIFAVNESGVLEGLMTDGDFRRWLLQQTSIDLHQSVSVALNEDFYFCNEKESVETIHAMFSDRIEHIALLDDHKRLVAIATNKRSKIIINDCEISEESPCFVIAEIGNNHNGSLDLAKKLIDKAIWAGVDCVKFQMRSKESLYRQSANEKLSEDLGTEYIQDLLAKFQLRNEDMFRAFDYCRSKGVIPLCTPWDLESLEELKKYDMPAYKLASADLTNHELLEVAANTNRPLLCSVGMSTDQEIISAVKLLQKQGSLFVLLQCNSTYPPPIKDINLNYLERLKKIGNCLVGYSGHERGINIPIAAVGLGAKVIEKHLTLDRTMEGNDHKISLLPEEFKKMVQGIHEVTEALGKGGPRHISQGELINRENLSKSLVINRDLKKGERIEPNYIEIRSPGQGLPPYRKHELIGKIAKRGFIAGDFFYLSDIKDENIEPKNYSFNRPWGMPVRFHDALTIYDLSNMDLFEFHLSYKDLELSIHKFFKNTLPIDFVVHCPEMFSGDHIIDFCDSSEKYRTRSIDEMQKVIDLTRELKTYFPKTKKPLIVTNIGGFSMNGHKAVSDRIHLYDMLSDSLSKLDTTGVELIPQTMPPFPWHFGGQRFHNLFVDPYEIVSFCKQNSRRVCLDISHSKLACNYYNWSFTEFIKIVGPYAAHLHIADAEGVDGEGLQIGEGQIDFIALGDNLNSNIPKVSFIPEIWQGHKNNGEGFFKALSLIELTPLKSD
jgi:sialic acid synthase SpsE/sugar phosphate isomerase/epimerase